MYLRRLVNYHISPKFGLTSVFFTEKVISIRPQVKYTVLAENIRSYREKYTVCENKRSSNSENIGLCVENIQSNNGKYTVLENMMTVYFSHLTIYFQQKTVHFLQKSVYFSSGPFIFRQDRKFYQDRLFSSTVYYTFPDGIFYHIIFPYGNFFVG